MNNLEEIKNIDIKHIIEKETSLHFKTKGNTHILENCPICSSGQRDGGTSAFSVKKNAVHKVNLRTSPKWFLTFI